MGTTSVTPSPKPAHSGVVAPADALKRARTTGRKEADILREILRYLGAIGVVAWRTNVGAVSSHYKGRTRFIRFGFPGLSDVIGIVPGSGRLFACEVKTDTGKLTPHQVAFLQLVNKSGGIGFVARSCDDIAAELGVGR